MIEPNLQDEITKKNAVILSNLVTLVSVTVEKIAGNDISNQIQNQIIKRDFLDNLVLSRINSIFIKRGLI